MNQPNDAIVASLASELGNERCACDQPLTISYFFGLANNGCGEACSVEFPCPKGQECRNGHGAAP
jgi:hypothetical protein